MSEKNPITRTRYSSLDMVRMANFAKENPKLKPIPLLKAYNEKYPEISKEQQLKNISNWLGPELVAKLNAKILLNKKSNEQEKR